MDWEWPGCCHVGKQNFWFREKLQCTKQWIQPIWKGGKKTKKEEIDAFSSKLICHWMKTMLLENTMHVMTQALRGGDGPHLPLGLSVVNMYTKVISGSKWLVVVVNKTDGDFNHYCQGCYSCWGSNFKCSAPSGSGTQNFGGARWGTRYPADLDVGWKGERRAPPATRLIWPRGVVWGKWSRHPCLFSWVPWHFLIGAQRTRLYWPSKTWNQSCWWWSILKRSSEGFSHPWWMISGHMWRRCWKQMLSVILVHKKDGCLHFCTDFCKLNARAKKDSYPLPQSQ